MRGSGVCTAVNGFVPLTGRRTHLVLHYIYIVFTIPGRMPHRPHSLEPKKLHEQQKASKIHRIGAQKRGSAITDPRQWLIIVNKWLEMRWWHFQLSKNPPSWPFNGHIAR